MNLESICDLIVVVGAAYFTIIKIINSFAKPSSKIKKKQEEKERERMRNFLKEIMPEYFKQHDEEFKKLILQKWKHWKVSYFSCKTCGAEWKSEPYEY